MSDDLRRIDLGGRVRTPGRKAERPALTWLAIDALRLDDSYQRPLGKSNWKNIETIARAFDWSRFTPILAAPLGGGLHAVIDGQHRTHAAALRGFDAVPAMVVPMSHAEQARAFAWVNGQVTAITVFHIYKAALAAMEPWALEATAAVEAAGCRLMTYPVNFGERKPREVYLIGLVREYVEAGRGAMVTAALGAIAASVVGDSTFAYANKALKQFLAALVLVGDWRALDLTRFLEENDIESLYDDVVAMRRNRPGLGREPASKVYRKVLVALMKKQLGGQPRAA